MNILINKTQVTAYNTPCSNIIIYESSTKDISVTIDKYYKTKSIRPISLNIQSCNNFTVETGKKVIIEFENEKPLFIFTYKKQNVNKEDYTYFFSEGEHSLDRLNLKSGDKVYVSAGAVLHTHIRAENSQNIEISGRGIIDISEISQKTHRMLKFISCENVCINDITLIGAIDWAIVPINCKNVNINGVNVITWEVNGDGIDVVGCQNVLVSNCFLHCADDCVAVKATDKDVLAGCSNCDNINFEKCILWNTRPGNCLEIGFETKCDNISNIVFSDCDVLHCVFEGLEAGGVFTIHNGDRALIKNITYKNIRVENAEQKLFDFKVILSKYSTDNERGFIENINIKDIFVFGEELPPSIIRATDNQHGIKNVRINGLYHNNKKIENRLQGHFITESGSELIFE